MRLFASALLACAALAGLAEAASLKGSVQFIGQFDAAALPPSSRVLLDHGVRQAMIRKDGSFEMHDVPEGRHVLTSSVPGFILQPLTVTVSGEATHVQPFQPGREPLPTNTPSLPYPLELTLLGKEDYFTQPAGMNIFGMLRNPMVLMMLVSGLLMWGMPKLLANIEMDPDMAKEVAETRKKMQGYQTMDLTKSLSSMLAGEGGDDAEAKASQAAASGNAAKKRPGRK